MDSTDFRIIDRLDQNSRASYPAVARCLGLASRTVQKRVAKMERSRLIRSFETFLDPSILGLHQAVCDVVAKSSSKNEEVRKALFRIPHVTEILTLAGGAFMVHLYYHTSSELRNTLTRINQTQGVADVQYEVAPWSRLHTGIRLTQTSLLILTNLSHNARKDLTTISKETGVSTRTVQRQLRWFHGQEFVRFGLDIDLSKVSKAFVYAALIRLKPDTAKQQILIIIKRTVRNVWRELPTMNPFTAMLWLHAASGNDLERDVEAIRLTPGVSNVRIMMVTSDQRKSDFLDAILRERSSI